MTKNVAWKDTKGVSRSWHLAQSASNERWMTVPVAADLDSFFGRVYLFVFHCAPQTHNIDCLSFTQALELCCTRIGKNRPIIDLLPSAEAL
jgi:hypothetical protein